MQQTYSDMSPNFSGFLMGISNTFANMPGFMAPLVAGYITHNNVI